MSNRKTEILKAASELFNEKGCLNTSTRHIADKLGISVGNLYYYFKNKEEILIEIYLRHLKDVFEPVNKIDFKKDEMFLFKDFLIENMDSCMNNRFIYMELNILLKTFPSFKKIVNENLKQEIVLLKELVKHQIKFGYIKDMSDKEIEFFVSNSWIVAVNRFSFWNILSEDFEQINKHSLLNKYFMAKPYLTKKSMDSVQLKELREFIGDVDE